MIQRIAYEELADAVANENARIDEAKRLLRQRGIRLMVGGCGCCGSPWFRVEVDGREILPSTDGIQIDMFEDDGEGSS